MNEVNNPMEKLNDGYQLDDGRFDKEKILALEEEIKSDLKVGLANQVNEFIGGLNLGGKEGFVNFTRDMVNNRTNGGKNEIFGIIQLIGILNSDDSKSFYSGRSVDGIGGPGTLGVIKAIESGEIDLGLESGELSENSPHIVQSGDNLRSIVRKRLGYSSAEECEQKVRTEIANEINRVVEFNIENDNARKLGEDSLSVRLKDACTKEGPEGTVIDASDGIKGDVLRPGDIILFPGEEKTKEIGVPYHPIENPTDMRTGDVSIRLNGEEGPEETEGVKDEGIADQGPVRLFPDEDIVDPSIQGEGQLESTEETGGGTTDVEGAGGPGEGGEEGKPELTEEIGGGATDLEGASGQGEGGEEGKPEMTREEIIERLRPAQDAVDNSPAPTPEVPEGPAPLDFTEPYDPDGDGENQEGFIIEDLNKL